ncbi:MAG: SET domain-containing protein [Actinomyces sp.]|nr:MAG: SET domain-containing protein [Actinomyces sp.]
MTRPPALRVGPSPIHGRGLFAGEAIAAGTVIGRFEGRRVDRDGPHVLWIRDADGGWYGIEGRSALRWVNHADEPNASFRDEELVALVDIAAGEEITVDYDPDELD